MGKLAWSDPEKGAPMKNQIPQGKFAGITKYQKLKCREISAQERPHCVNNSSFYCISKSFVFGKNAIKICAIYHAQILA